MAGRTQKQEDILTVIADEKIKADAAAVINATYQAAVATAKADYDAVVTTAKQVARDAHNVLK